MSNTTIDTLVIGGGQAGLAMSGHLRQQGQSHLILERHRIAERWRTERWDSLVANGPAWHDRFPARSFDGDPERFATKAEIVGYFEGYARQIEAPIRCGVEVTALEQVGPDAGFRISTSAGQIDAANVVVATGPFQRPVMPSVVPATAGIDQLHSSAYRNPTRLREGAVLVVGAGSSGVQIADELARAGRSVYLSVGPHNRPPRRYRGRDFVWWLGVLGEWDMTARTPGTEHVTIAVSGARGGTTVDFRQLAAGGITLLGRAAHFGDGSMHFAADLAENIARGDANYLSVLDDADAYVARTGIELPEEPDARKIGAPPDSFARPIPSLDLAEAGISTIIWATGYTSDFSWIHADAFDAKGLPAHRRGVSVVPGLYFLGLSWLATRASAFIWGCWRDAEYLAAHIAARAERPPLSIAR